MVIQGKEGELVGGKIEKKKIHAIPNTKLDVIGEKGKFARDPHNEVDIGTMRKNRSRKGER